MKKFILCIISLAFISGCSFNTDPYDGAVISSTVYPITYLIESLYGDYSTTSSIYPSDALIDEYSLTEKQIINYANDSDMFVYLGVSDEKNIAKDFVNENDDILLIDATMNLDIDYSIEELWLSPNNYLMLAKNIRDNLFESLENQYTLEVVDENYASLSETLSIMDAELRQIANTAVANDNSILVVTSDAFMYLENYGFTVISLENESNSSDDAISSINSNFKSGRYLALINEYGSENDVINTMVDDYNAEAINMNTFYSSNLEVDYLEAMYNFIFELNLLVND